MRVSRTLHFRVGDRARAGRLAVSFEADAVRRQEGATGSGGSLQLQQLSGSLEMVAVEVLLCGEDGQTFDQPLVSANRGPGPLTGGAHGHLGPWTCTPVREVEGRWAQQRVAAFGASALDYDLQQLARLLAALLGAALPPERFPARRLLHALRPALLGLGTSQGNTVVGPGAGGASVELPLGPAELLAHPPFAELIACR